MLDQFGEIPGTWCIAEGLHNGLKPTEALYDGGMVELS